MENRIKVNNKKPWFLIMNIAVSAKVVLTLIMTVLIALLSKGGVTNTIFVIYNGGYLLAAEAFVCLALWGLYVEKDKVKHIKEKKNKKDGSIITNAEEKVIPYDVETCTRLRVSSMIYLIGMNVVTIVAVFFGAIYLLKLIFSISGDNAGQFFISIGKLIPVLLVIVIALACIYSFFGAVNRYSHHRKHVILGTIKEENKTYYSSIAITLFVLAGFVIISSLLVWLLANNEFITTYVNIFFNNLVNLSAFAGIGGILLFISSVLSGIVYVLVGLGMLEIKKCK